MVLGSIKLSVVGHGIAPFRYLEEVLRRLPATSPDHLTELLPDIWFQTHPYAAGKRARNDHVAAQSRVSVPTAKDSLELAN